MADCGKRELDLAIIMDCTTSMTVYIESAMNSVREIVNTVQEKCDVSSVRLALVNFRDHIDEHRTFLTEVHDFTEDVNTMKQWLAKTSALGGNDVPEAIADALNAALKLNWRQEATKICAMVTDAPPHGTGHPRDSYPDGCPYGIDPIEVAKKMALESIVLYVIGCEPTIKLYKETYMGITSMTGGQYVPMHKAKSFADAIIGSIKEEIDMNKVKKDVEKEVSDLVAVGRTEEEINRLVHEKMTAKGVKISQLVRNDAPLENAVDNEAAKAISKLCSVSEMKTNFNLQQLMRTSNSEFTAGFTLPKGRATEQTDEKFDVKEDMMTISQTSRLVKKSLAKGGLCSN